MNKLLALSVALLSLNLYGADKPQKWEYCIYKYAVLSGPGYSSPLESIIIKLPNESTVSIFIDADAPMKAAIEGFTKKLKSHGITINMPDGIYKSKTLDLTSFYILNGLGNSHWELAGHTKINIPPPRGITTKILEEVWTLKRPKN